MLTEDFFNEFQKTLHGLIEDLGVLRVSWRSLTAEVSKLQVENRRLREAVETFVAWLDAEDARMPDTIIRDTPEGEVQWRAWYYGKQALCDKAMTLGRQALAGEAEEKVTK